MPVPVLVLASASPQRRTLLRSAGFVPRVHPSRLTEDLVPEEAPRTHVRRLASAKANRVRRALETGGAPFLVLGADTAVVVGDELLGKPRNRAHARTMLLRLAGRSHRVLTAVHVSRTDDGRVASRVEVSRVRFRAFGEQLADWYVDTGEPMDKAGAYGIQGRGALLVDGIAGSWSNVVGLPLERLPDLFAAVGVDFRDLLATS